MINESDFAELRSAMLTGVTVGVGSQVLIFENGVTILIQCPFKCDGRVGERWGHGEDFTTGVLIFDFLNHKLEDVFFEAGEALKLDFGEVGSLMIVPEKNGFESYVLTTRFGISPVSVV
ncbi:hypothetical protein [Pseudomonas citronellolis]|uniref:hypothetical protein n=1 Tax=Pseudomonas citronellolis TaxID=53408 RepID=UPI0023E3656E|nr:hypothetical protein [Pseudomonas citronellolis]MDF3933785.1 hypothetical protein [Pseudomonas citronellolis]